MEMSNILNEEGVKRTEQGVFCSRCNVELEDRVTTQFMYRFDDNVNMTFTNHFQCVKCGNCISQTVKKRISVWWDDGHG